jgi:putative protease
VLEVRAGLKASSSGRCRYTFTPDPERAYNRGGTDYFVNGRQIDIGAFDTPKHAGIEIGHVVKLAPQHVDIELATPALRLNNGDALTWVDLQGNLQGVPVNVARHLAGRLWRVEPNIAPGQTTAVLKGLRRDAAISRNRDMAWERLLEKKSAERLIAVDLRFAGRAINPITQTNWEGTGVSPDIATAADDALRVAQVQALKGLQQKAQADPALQRQLQARLVELEKSGG